MSTELSPEEKERAKWLEEYQRLSKLFEFYLELVFKAFTFTLGAAGGVCAFVLGDKGDRSLASWGLFLPAILCFGMGLAFLRARKSAEQLNATLQELKRKLENSLAPHATNLTASLWGFGWLLVVSGGLLFGLFGCLVWKGSHGPRYGAMAGGTHTPGAAPESVCRLVVYSDTVTVAVGHQRSPRKVPPMSTPDHPRLA